MLLKTVAQKRQNPAEAGLDAASIGLVIAPDGAGCTGRTLVQSQRPVAVAVPVDAVIMGYLLVTRKVDFGHGWSDMV
jgi:hypothetical protein